MTKRLFLEDSAAAEMTATVIRATQDGIVLDRTLFYARSGGQPGDSGALRWDGGTTPITEAVKVQFRAEAFNISNTPNFYIDNNVNSGPDTRLGNSNFGQIISTDPNYVPRQLQFALKLQF